MKKLFQSFKMTSIDNKRRKSLTIRIVVVLAILLSIGSFIYYYSQGLTLAYGDAKSHLNIARRVIFSLNPGLAQLGGIWLPLPHLLMLLTIWNDFFYYSGLSGSIISMISYIVAIVIIYKSVYFYTKNIASSILGAAIMALNPAFLYFQTTPMTELLSISFSMLPIYILMKWSKSNNFILLVIAGFVVALSTLSRYDNLFLIPASALVIIVVMLLKRFKKTTIEGGIILFLTLAVFGMLLWLLYNQIIFGNATNFAFGEGSASWFATNQNAVTKHSLYLTLLTFSWMMIDNVGLLSLILMMVGVIVFLIKNKLKADSIPAYLFLVPIAFNITSLFLGQSIARTQHLPPYELYNTRYGINALPAVAFFVAMLSSYSKKWLLAVVLVLALVTQYYILFKAPLYILQDAVQYNLDDRSEAANWIRNNQADGLVLVDTGTFDALVFQSRIPLDKVIYSGSGKIWNEALMQPENYTKRIIIGENVFGTDSDPVGKILLNSKALTDNFHVIYSNTYVHIYERNW